MDKLMDSKLGGQAIAVKWNIREKYGAKWPLVARPWCATGPFAEISFPIIGCLR